MKVGFVSLGCSKNLIDTEVVIGKLKNHNFEITNNPQEAEIIIINTCGFIQSAKEEAINTILEMAKYKSKNCKYLVAMGCLVQRYYDELLKTLPEVDLLIKIEEYNKFWEKIEHLINSNKKELNYKQEVKDNLKISKEQTRLKELPMFMRQEYIQRTITTGKNYAYLKIAEGCSNMCTYCAIPYIRGKFTSRRLEDIIAEAENLAKQGITELIIIAQDTTKYGIDIYKKPMLAELLSKLCKIEDIHWIRFLYSYPEGITDELIDVVKREEKISNYFDIPIQHVSNTILKNMNRKTSKQNIENLIAKIKNKIPNCTLRTSLIVGFPGESDEDFEELYDFVKEIQFDKLGVFEYSKEEKTPAAKMPNQIHHMTKKARYNKIMKLQQEISYRKMQKKLGTSVEVLLEKSLNKEFFIGRTKADVPDIDGIVYVKKNKGYELNQFVNCKIVGFDNYDLVAE